jgi:hypothetical protein
MPYRLSQTAASRGSAIGVARRGVHSAASCTTSISKVPPSLLHMTFGSGPRAASSRISGVSIPQISSGPTIVLRC